MKVVAFKIPKAEEKSLIFQIDEGKEFYASLHQHKEIQISIILNGEGDLLAGDTVTRYAAGDIVVFGADLPHLFKSDTSAGLKSHMLTIFYRPESFGHLFNDFRNLSAFQKYETDIKSGIKILTDEKEIKKKFLSVKNSSNLAITAIFFDLLQIIIDSKWQTLSSFGEQKTYSEDEGSRMSRVMNLAISNFNRNISLKEAANLANMTENAFCRYFKQRTRKTFFEFLLEIRLNNAGRLLLKSTDMGIGEISELCGFRNISNFNRKFKAKWQCTPSAYRKNHLQLMK